LPRESPSSHRRDASYTTRQSTPVIVTGRIDVCMLKPKAQDGPKQKLYGNSISVSCSNIYKWADGAY